MSKRRPSFYKKSYHAPGTAPATLTPPSDAKPGKGCISLIEYDALQIEESKPPAIEQVFPCRDNAKVSWINIDGLGDAELIRKMGAHFHLHPLALEDVLNTHQRAKVEEYEGYLFVVLHIPYADAGHAISSEQISMFISETFLITIQEDETRDVFEPVRQRLRQARGYARGLRSDYLAYMLIDAIVDHFFPVLEDLGDGIEELEEQLLEQPQRDAIRKLHEYKRTLVQLRRFAWPQRDVLATLAREDSPIILPQTRVFLRDCGDHSIQIFDIIESYRDLTAGMMDLYHSIISNRTNDVMKVLTIMSTIFIPLTFLAGIYGMNFDPDAGPLSMPELKTPYGYITLLALMALIAGTMLAVFKKKKWI